MRACLPDEGRRTRPDDDAVKGGTMLIQISGSLAVLAAFILVRTKRMNPNGIPYLMLNAFGSAAVALDALGGHAWGVLMLEGVWSIVSFVGLAQTLARER